MKTKRQAKILEIITETDVETQEQLLDTLGKCGFVSTQATISRDIKEMRLVKELTEAGTYRYKTAMADAATSFSSRLNTIFRECVIHYDHAQNMVVIKTLPGLASAAAAAVDGMSLPVILGTLAGDDTVFIVMRDTPSASGFCAEIKKILE